MSAIPRFMLAAPSSGTGTLFAGFPHLYFYGNPKFAENFVKAAARYAENNPIS